MARMSKRKVPPSRIKYENNHPTVTCRVSKEIYDRLTESKKVDGKSFADILKMGLGIVEKQDKKLVETRDKAYNKGYAEAGNRYTVTYPCATCGKDMEVTSWKEKLAIKQFMKENGWGHKECHDKQK